MHGKNQNGHGRKSKPRKVTLKTEIIEEEVESEFDEPALETPQTEKPNCAIVHGTSKAITTLAAVVSASISKTYGEDKQNYTTLAEELNEVLGPLADKHEDDTLTWEEFRNSSSKILQILADRLK